MDDLELIKEKINIVDLVQEYLPLKKAGVNFKANCPFHQEKTPSFVVSPERGIFHCFGCQKGGDIFRFLMEKEGIEFKEALEILAKRAGVVLKNQNSNIKDQKQKLYEANAKAAEFYHYLLLKHALGKKAFTYLKGRGLTDETIDTFNLGYAPNSWDSLTKFLTKRGFTVKDLIDSGLAVESRSGCYDRFRGRVMFPLQDVRGQIIGFAGRILDKGEPKYINTSQTAIFDKSHFLFGLNLSKGEIRTKDTAILTEGEMDMIMSYQSGIKNVVATKGTALTSGHIELLKKYTQTILLCFDMDIAGDTASRRGIEMADSAGFDIKVVKVEGVKDPAEAVVKDPSIWEKAVKEAEPIYDYYLRSAASRYDQRTPDGKRKIAAEIFPILAKITDIVQREHYIQKLSALIAIPEDLIRVKLEKGSLNIVAPDYQNLVGAKTSVSEVQFRPRRELLEEYLLALLLKIPPTMQFVPNFPETIFLNENYKSLYVLLVVYLDSISFQAKEFKIADFVKSLPPELLSIADRLYLIEIDDKLSSPENWQQEVAGVVLELKRALIKASLEKLSAQIKNAQVFGKIDTLELLNRRFRDLSQKLKSI